MYAFIQTVVVPTTPQDSLECGFDYINELPTDLVWDEFYSVFEPGLTQTQLNEFHQVFGGSTLTRDQLVEFDAAFGVDPMELVGVQAPDNSMPRAPKHNDSYSISVDDLLDACFGADVAWPEAIPAPNWGFYVEPPLLEAVDTVAAHLNDLGAEVYEPGNGWGFWALDNLVISYQVGVSFNISYINKEIGLNLALGTAMQGVV